MKIIQEIQKLFEFDCSMFFNFFIENEKKKFKNKTFEEFLLIFYNWLDKSLNLKIPFTKYNLKNTMENTKISYISIFREKNLRNCDLFIKENQNKLIKMLEKIDKESFDCYKILKKLFWSQSNFFIVKNFFEYFCDILNENNFNDCYKEENKGISNIYIFHEINF